MARRMKVETKMGSVPFVVDDYVDSPELHRVDGPLASFLHARGTSFAQFSVLRKSFHNKHSFTGE